MRKSQGAGGPEEWPDLKGEGRPLPHIRQVMLSTFMILQSPDLRNSDRVTTQLKFPELHLDGGAQGWLSVQLPT